MSERASIQTEATGPTPVREPDDPLRAGLEMLLVGAVAAAVAYGIGVLGLKSST